VGIAWPLWGQPLGRTVDDLVPRPTVCARGTCLHGSGRGAEEPHASRDHYGLRLRVVRCQAGGAAVWHVEAPIDPLARRLGPGIGPPLRLLALGASHVSWTCAAPSPSLRRTGERPPFRHPLAEDGTRGQSGCAVVEFPRAVSARVAPTTRAPQDVCGAALGGHQETDTKTAHVAREGRRSASSTAAKKSAIRSEEGVSLDYRGPHKGSAGWVQPPSLGNSCGPYADGSCLKTTRCANHCSTSWRDTCPVAIAKNTVTISSSVVRSSAPFSSRKISATAAARRLLPSRKAWAWVR
jgi:hypothetical protein